MNQQQFPIPHSHKTFQFGSVTIDSNFDSGNLFNVERISNVSYNLWLAVDHPKNQYRTWFHFSLKGLGKGSVVSFNIKNMQNQSRLLNEGLVPVFRQENSRDWKRIVHKIDLSRIEYNQGWIQWTFKHTMTSQQKVYFAFFYPWSNVQNDQFLKRIQEKCKAQDDIYFKRSSIIRSLEGRPVQFITISSKKYILTKKQQFQDQFLFTQKDEPKQFTADKKCIIIGARVHPGQVPSSHVMTGIIQQLSQNSQKIRLLRDKFVFYLFPIFNPDGVARGHYRVDPNGINLNRCYINPSPKNHSPIYAVKKVILHFHKKQKYFGFLDLHAHAARKGVFIYGNSTNQLEKQVQICLFPKILSMNSEIFEYQGSNFTQRNMYCKDINDHVSKQGAGRVALFKATKNPYSWTLECNYNTSRILNVLDQKKQQNQQFKKPQVTQLDKDLIVNYKCLNTKQPKQFYTIQHFRKLGKQICESFLDLVELNPQSRIDNAKSLFKSVQNLKMNLAVALLRMAPNRFEQIYKRIYYCIQGPSSTKQLSQRAVKALYYLLVKKAKIQNINSFLKDNDDSSVILPMPIKNSPKKTLSPQRQSSPDKRKLFLIKSSHLALKKIKDQQLQQNFPQVFISKSRQICYSNQDQSPLKLVKIDKKQKQQNYQNRNIQSPDSQQQDSNKINMYENLQQKIILQKNDKKKQENKSFQFKITSKLLNIHDSPTKNQIKYQQQAQTLKSFKRSLNTDQRKYASQQRQSMPNSIRPTQKQMPSMVYQKIKAMMNMHFISNQVKLIRKGKSMKQTTIFYVPSG